uniref:Uncharacterized protein n=1 Tax=Chloropicon laureae TaxID=464258 RepID=A0A7S2Z2Z3_9CHLO|mmetsp:Transcript_3684/g.9287  ORF Transcript_3684/g.9287 Transcript_3684/m.9287 type:complete len:276 (+) Transcript_3684:26-853(+)
MLFRSRDMCGDSHRLVSSWRNGGYSDDLIASSVCQRNKLTIVCNPSNVFAQELPVKTSFQEYWNYMSRQVFVLDTYTSQWHKWLNHFLIFIHTYISLFFAMAMLLNLYRYAASLLLLVSLLTKIFSGNLHSEVYQYSVRHAYVSTMQWAVGHVSAICFSLFLLFAVVSLKHFFEAMDRLFSELYDTEQHQQQHQHQQRLSSKHEGRERIREEEKGAAVYSLRFGWWQHVTMWVALCIDVVLFIPAAAKALFSQEIEWSGVKYCKKGGLVSKVTHQ